MPGDILQFVGESRALQLFGVKLLGFNAENGKKLLFTLAFIAVVLLLSAGVKRLVQIFIRGDIDDVHRRFWTTQGVKVFTAVLLIIGIASIWFDDPTRLTTAAGMVSAGLAFALQRVVTAVSGYFVILRGDVFSAPPFQATSSFYEGMSSASVTVS
jgi:small-conductance mechanosensitive channel